MTITIVYETTVCPRCNGTGHYSRCQTWGTSCFKCGAPNEKGHGRAFVRRARRAFDKLEERFGRQALSLRDPSLVPQNSGRVIAGKVDVSVEVFDELVKYAQKFKGVIALAWDGGAWAREAA